MNKLLIFLSPLAILPMIVLCIGLGMPPVLVVIGSALYTYVLIKTIAN